MKNYDVFIARIIIVLVSGSIAFFPAWLVAVGFKSLLGLGGEIASGMFILVGIFLLFLFYRILSTGDVKNSTVMKKWLTFKLWASTLTEDADTDQK